MSRDTGSATKPRPPQQDWETLFDPYGIRRFWSGKSDEAQPGSPATSGGPADPYAFWREWMQAAVAHGGHAVELEVGLAGLIPRLAEVAGRAWQQVLTEQPAAREPYDLFQRWYQAASGPLAEVTDDALENEALLRSVKQFSDRSAAMDKTFRNAAEQYFSRLQLATASDVDRIAGMIVDLDDKVDRLEDELEQTQPGGASADLGEVERRLERVERALATLGRLEDKLDRLLAAGDTTPNGRVPTRTRAVQGAAAKGTRKGAEVQ